ncbi:MAG: response regulator transcription factor [Bacteroidetes bacterium]|jgi:DNA-binding response OmpR family regulator|nr:response regulator transcription factor [Bacteroidota bacterium]
MSADTHASILIVEDEESIATVVAHRLSRSGYRSDWAPTGELGLQKARATPFDLILLDIHLPGISGFDVLETLRKEGLRTPVFIVSADRFVDDRVKGLRLGADDYLVKPFDFDELMARIEAILRRSAAPRPPQVKVGDVSINVEEQKATRAGRSLEMSNIEFRLLEFLARNKNQAVSRAEIAKEIWGHENYKETNVIDVYMGYLRSALDGGQKQKMIFDTFDGGFVLKG